MTEEPRSAESLAAAIAAILQPVFGRLDELAGAVAATRPAEGPWTEHEVGEVQGALLAHIAADNLHVGMGFVAEPSAVNGLERYMLWWQQNEGRTSRLRLNFDRTSIDVYDYVEMEWFQRPRSGARRQAFGPYVDYSGSELYIVTATVPVATGETFHGVVGVDLLFGELERRLLSVLRTAAVDAVLVNAERRVISTNSPRWVLGSRLPVGSELGQAPAGGSRGDVAEVPGGFGWRLALMPPAPG